MSEYSNKELALEYLKHCDEQTVCMAYMYAKHYCQNGVNITEMITAVQNAQALDRAYIRGFSDGVNLRNKIKGKDNEQATT